MSEPNYPDEAEQHMEQLPAEVVPIHTPPVQVNRQTGEITPLQSRAETVAMMVVPLAKMNEIIAYVEEMRNTILKKDVDYGIVPGTKKPTIYKAGVEKLEFAFMLTVRMLKVDAYRDWNAMWKYYVEDRNGFEVEKQAVGDITVTVTVGVYLRGTDILICEASGTCSRRERGRETAPENTIVKMAMKRAKASAVLEATFSSDRFTVDIDTYDPKEVGQIAKSQESSGKMRTIKSKYGTVDKPSKCNFCGNAHIVIGDEMCLAPDTCVVESYQRKWGAMDCYTKGIAAVQGQ